MCIRDRVFSDDRWYRSGSYSDHYYVGSIDSKVNQEETKKEKIED